MSTKGLGLQRPAACLQDKKLENKKHGISYIYYLEILLQVLEAVDSPFEAIAPVDIQLSTIKMNCELIQVTTQVNFKFIMLIKRIQSQKIPFVSDKKKAKGVHQY